MAPINPDAADFVAYKRRRDAARRCEPLDNGRRDPHRGPDRYAARPDPATEDALAVLRALWGKCDTRERAALTLAAQALADAHAGRGAA